MSILNFFNTVALVSFLLAQYWGWRAMRHLSPQGHDRIWRIILLGFCATADDFTEQGQKYGTRTRWAVLVAVACIIAAGVARMWG